MRRISVYGLGLLMIFAGLAAGCARYRSSCCSDDGCPLAPPAAAPSTPAITPSPSDSGPMDDAEEAYSPPVNGLGSR